MMLRHVTGFSATVLLAGFVGTLSFALGDGWYRSAGDAGWAGWLTGLLAGCGAVCCVLDAATGWRDEVLAERAKQLAAKDETIELQQNLIDKLEGSLANAYRRLKSDAGGSE